ncbi:hypothetical protein ABZZ17_22665 [Streptomyces sp. NPDC006512]|uniref:hypothetical protein n=1 Tax=Streptomyces sp. NPDC006512 TaxID=3154307 RepID=UPI0033AABBC5
MSVDEATATGSAPYGTGPAAIHEVTPREGSSGDFSTVAPQVVLHGAGPYWERNTAGAPARIPRLAVLVCRDIDPRTVPGRRAAGTAPRRMLEMGWHTFTEVIAPPHRLPSLVEPAAAAGLQDRPGDPYPSAAGLVRVRAHRMPRTPGGYVAHLVSLEDCAPYLTSPHGPRERTVRLESLHSWSFHHVATPTETRTHP